MEFVDIEKLEIKIFEARLLIERSVEKRREICGIELGSGEFVCTDKFCSRHCFQRRKEDNVSNGSGDRKD